MGASDRRSRSVRTIVTISLLVAMELALTALESTFPPFIPFPGVKLGLANIVTLISFSLIKKRQVLLVVLLRLILTGLVLGTFLTPAFWISSGGGLLSFFVMAIGSGCRLISIVGVSLIGAAAHNIGQLIALSLLLSNVGVIYYLPWLLLWSVPTGLFTGFSARLVISALRGAGYSPDLTRRKI